MTTSTSPAPPIVRLRSPGEIVSAVPFLLGFAPESSVVVVAMRGRRMSLTCRADLDDVVDPSIASDIASAVGRGGATHALVIGYADTRASAAAGVGALSESLRDAGLAIQERLTVVDGRWFNEDCHDGRCCPREGSLVADHDEAPSTMAFHAITEGYRAGREDLVRECRPDRPLLMAAIRSELAVPAEDVDWLEDTLVADLLAVLRWSGGGEPSAVQVARSALACADPSVRDLWYSLVAPAVLFGGAPELSAAHVSLRRAGQAAGDLGLDGTARDVSARDRMLGRILASFRNLPDDIPEVTMPALVVTATAHWCAGDGARARLLVERAMALPGRPLPMLLTVAHCLAHGVGPGDLGRLDDSRPEAGRERRSIA